MTNRNRILIVLVCFSMIGSHAGGALSAADGGNTAEDIAARITRLEENLAPLVIVEGVEPRGYSLQERMEYHRVPGVSIAVINNNRLEWARGYGIADKRTGRRVDENTIFRAGSISKPLTAAAAIRMVEMGALELDSDANRYLSTWKVSDNEFSIQNNVTLRHLLSHTGGVTEGAFKGYAQGEEVPELVQILDGTDPANTPPVRIEAVPGATWKYSNGGYCIIQMIEYTEKLTPYELIARLITHIPDPWEQTTRYFGYYSNRSRGKRK